MKPDTSSPEKRQGATTPLFDYSVTPPEVDTSRDQDHPIKLTLGIYNRKQNGAVTVSRIDLAISIGQTENSLTDDAANVLAHSTQAGWLIQKIPYTASPLVFRITPDKGNTVIKPNESISFELTGIHVNDREGPAALNFSEVTAKQTASETVLINKASPSLKITGFYAVPDTVKAGDSATLSWTTSGASYCTIHPLEGSLCSAPPHEAAVLTSDDQLPPEGHQRVCPKQTTTYTLTAHDPGGGYRKQQFTITVARVRIPSFTANPANTEFTAPTSKLQWEVENATKLTLDPGGLDVTGKTFCEVTPDETTIYKLTAEGAGHSVYKETTVNVHTVLIESFKAEPTSFAQGQPVTLSWKTKHAGSLSIDEGVGEVKPLEHGSVAVHPSKEKTTYTLTAKGFGPVAKMAADPVTLLPTGWHAVAPPGFMQGVALNYRGKIWMIDYTDTGLAYCSKDALSWEAVGGKLPFANRLYCAGAVFDGGGGEKMWIMGGAPDTFDPQHMLNDVWSSEDGINWTQVQTSGIWSGRMGHACVAFKGKLWVLGGCVSNKNRYIPQWPAKPDKVWSSTDGIHWTQSEAPWRPRSFLGACVFNPAPNVNQLWLCGGTHGEFPTTASTVMGDAWYTDDGVKWTQAHTPAWPTRVAQGRLQQLNNKLYLIGGHTNVLGMKGLTDMWAMDASMNWTSVGNAPDGYDFGYTPPAAFVFDWRFWLVMSAVADAKQHYYNP